MDPAVPRLLANGIDHDRELRHIYVYTSRHLHDTLMIVILAHSAFALAVQFFFNVFLCGKLAVTIAHCSCHTRALDTACVTLTAHAHTC